jgi:hypothetical protein
VGQVVRAEDYDTWLHARRGVPHHRRVRPHQHLLQTVWERYRPTVLGLGPQAIPKEEPEAVEVAVAMIRGAGKWFGVPVIELTAKEVCEVLGTNQRQLTQCVQNQLETPLVFRERRALMAAAVGLAALLKNDVSRETQQAAADPGRASRLNQTRPREA